METLASLLRFQKTSLSLKRRLMGNSDVLLEREYERVRVGNSSIERHMYPVRVAYARTVHKTQGETIFGKLFIHVEGMETPGEAYVAFSRPTSLDNVTILPAGVNLTPEMFVPHVPQE